jgi:hypothetical protein
MLLLLAVGVGVENQILPAQPRSDKNRVQNHHASCCPAWRERESNQIKLCKKYKNNFDVGFGGSAKLNVGADWRPFFSFFLVVPSNCSCYSWGRLT